MPERNAMRAKQHFGVRRTPVPGKVCFPYVTGHRRKRGEKKFRSGDEKFRRKHAENKFFEFLVAVYRGKVRIVPATRRTTKVPIDCLTYCS